MTENEQKTIYRKADDARRRDDLRQILSTPSGRRLLMHVVTQAGIYRTSETSESVGLAYAAGKRDLGLDLLSAFTHADSAAVHIAMQERETELAERASTLAALRQNEQRKN